MMDQVDFGYSMKNISIPSRKEYILRLTHSVSKFMNNLRWRAYFYLEPNEREPSKKETFGFKSLKPAPHVEQLDAFGEKMIELIAKVETKKVKNDFQEKLKEDSEKIKKDEKLLIPADKTVNFYKMDKEMHDTLMKKNVTKDYKKTDNTTNDNIDKKTKEIVTKLELDDRVFATAQKEATITIKDHKENFRNNTTCRLINPTKSELGKISKQKLAKIVSEVKAKTKVNQWKNTNSVLSWFNNLPNKAKTKFIMFDIEAFYPSISEELLARALAWAGTKVTITEEDITIINHCKQSLLYSKGSPWTKQGDSLFDVAMGSYDGAETCDLVGLFLLEQMKHLPINPGLYRDDGLAASQLTARQNEMMRKEIQKIYLNNGLRLVINANLTVVDFLDVTLDLNDGTHRPYMKPNNTPLYVHNDSNHPPSVLKNIPLGINKRLSTISSGKEQFDAAKRPYQEALAKSGYSYELEYERPREVQPRSRNRNRKVTWFNPPFSKSISTNIGQKFLAILDSSFPPGHDLHKLFNRSTVKLSYSTMPNMGQAINQHNGKLAGGQKEPTSGCNCRGAAAKASCPMRGNCLAEGVVYCATVTDTTTNTVETYTGLTGGAFKTRYNAHKGNLKNRDQQHKTTLSSHIWRLKDSNKPYTVSWKILARASTFNTTTHMCRLCLMEKYLIMSSPATATLNSRSEIYSSCRHRKGKLLCS